MHRSQILEVMIPVVRNLPHRITVRSALGLLLNFMAGKIKGCQSWCVYNIATS